MKTFRKFSRALIALSFILIVVLAVVVVRQKDAEIAKLRSELKVAEGQVAILGPKARRAWKMPVEIDKLPDGRLIVVNQSDAPLPVTFSGEIDRGAFSVMIPKPGAWLVDAEPGQVVDISSGTFEPISIRAQKTPNQTPEPTSPSVTDRADARSAPAGAVAHL